MKRSMKAFFILAALNILSFAAQTGITIEYAVRHGAESETPKHIEVWFYTNMIAVVVLVIPAFIIAVKGLLKD